MLSAEYLAGVFDSDGCFSAHVGRIRPGRKREDVFIKVGLGWSDSPLVRSVLKELQEHYGGRIYESAPGKGRKRWVVHYWLFGRSALPFIADVLPYLRLKARQATLCVEGIKIGMDPTTGSRLRRLTSEAHARRLEICAEVQALNRGELAPEALAA